MLELEQDPQIKEEASSGDSGDEGEEENVNCVICLKSAITGFKSYSNFSHKEPFLDEHLRTVFVLKNLLHFPKIEFQQLLTDSNGVDPGNWCCFCVSCIIIVRDAFYVFKKISKLERKLEKMRTCLRSELDDSLRSESCEDKENGRFNGHNSIRKYYREKLPPLSLSPSFSDNNCDEVDEKHSTGQISDEEEEGPEEDCSNTRGGLKTELLEEKKPFEEKLHSLAPIQCPICRKEYTSLVKFKNHRATHDAAAETITLEGKCAKCDFSTGSQTLLKYHRELHFIADKGNMSMETLLEERTSVQFIRMDGDLKLECEALVRGCRTEGLYTAAIVREMKSVGFTISRPTVDCIIKRIGGKRKADVVIVEPPEEILPSSEVVHQPVKLTHRCSICRKKYRNPSTLVKHQATHGALAGIVSEEKCEKCDFSAGSPTIFNYHQELHEVADKIQVSVAQLVRKRSSMQFISLPKELKLECERVVKGCYAEGMRPTGISREVKTLGFNIHRSTVEYIAYNIGVRRQEEKMELEPKSEMDENAGKGKMLTASNITWSAKVKKAKAKIMLQNKSKARLLPTSNSIKRKALQAKPEKYAKKKNWTVDKTCEDCDFTCGSLNVLEYHVKLHKVAKDEGTSVEDLVKERNSMQFIRLPQDLKLECEAMVKGCHKEGLYTMAIVREVESVGFNISRAAVDYIAYDIGDRRESEKLVSSPPEIETRMGLTSQSSKSNLTWAERLRTAKSMNLSFKERETIQKKIACSRKSIRMENKCEKCDFGSVSSTILDYHVKLHDVAESEELSINELLEQRSTIQFTRLRKELKLECEALVKGCYGEGMHTAAISRDIISVGFNIHRSTVESIAFSLGLRRETENMEEVQPKAHTSGSENISRVTTSKLSRSEKIKMAKANLSKKGKNVKHCIRSNASSLDRYYQATLDPPAQCLLCRKKYMNLSSFKKHQAKHHGKLSIKKCEFCDFRAGSPTIFEYHLNLHKVADKDKISMEVLLEERRATRFVRLPENLKEECEGLVRGCQAEGIYTAQILKQLPTVGFIITLHSVNVIGKDIMTQRKALHVTTRSRKHKIVPVNKKLLPDVINKIKKLAFQKVPLTYGEIAEKVNISRATVCRAMKNIMIGKTRSNAYMQQLNPPKQVQKLRNFAKRFRDNRTAKESAKYIVVIAEVWMYLENGRICYSKIDSSECELPEEKVKVIAVTSGRGVLPLMKVTQEELYHVDYVLKPLLEDGIANLYGNEFSKVVIYHLTRGHSETSSIRQYAEDLKRRTGVTSVFVEDLNFPQKLMNVNPFSILDLGYVKRRLRSVFLTSLEDAWILLEKEWSSMPKKVIRNFTFSWERNLQRRQAGKEIAPLENKIGGIFRCKLCGIIRMWGAMLHHLQEKHGVKQNKAVRQEKPLLCDICGETFKVKRYLENHRVTVHLNQAPVYPFICDICGTGFSAKHGWKRHVNTFHKEMLVKPWRQIKKETLSLCKSPEWVCHICSEKFVHRGKLQVHVRTVHGDVFRHQCDKCDSAYQQSSSLEAHVLARHSRKGKRKAS